MLLDIAVGFYGVGAFFLLLGSFWLIAIASKDAAGWRYTVAIIPLVNIIYGAFHWSRCKVPMVVMLAGLGILLIGVLIMLSVDPTTVEPATT